MRILEVVGLTKRFGGRVALDAVSFTAEEGQIFALFGPRGAGKTTCGDCLSGVIPPDTGRIIFDGRELTGGDRHDLARAGLARTFQVANVFPRLTAADNVAIGLGRHRFPRLAVMLRAWRRASTRPQALAILTRAGLADAADQPAGLLPLGMRKRLEIARALAGRPRLILLDEPFGGLSDAETGAMTKLIASLRDEGLTVVLIEHRMDAAMDLADRAVVLDRGTVIAAGAPERVRSDPKVIEAYLREDAGASRH
jgi:branched-chain amino acid transport system ATP-binding protein